MWVPKRSTICHLQHLRPHHRPLRRRHPTNCIPCECRPRFHHSHPLLHDLLYGRSRDFFLRPGTTPSTQKDYFLGYYFWLDLVSTLTMAFDLIWISQYLTGGGQNAANISQISRASRAARLGTRTVKLIRLIRMVKLLKQMKSLSHDIAKNQK